MNKETKALLRKRAIVLAEEPEEKKAASTIVELIIFKLASETYGIESAFVREVFPMKDFTFLPGLPAYITGIINVRGQILSVVNLKKLFSIPEIGIGELNKVIILQDSQMEFGILADVVLGNQTIETDDIRETPPTVSGTGFEYLKGVTTGNLIILNGEKLVSDKSIVINEVVSGE